jgi:membrane protein DedA with SNARE-associated domain
MLHLLACFLAILSGLTFALTASIYDISGSNLWIGYALAFGLIACSIPVLKKGRRLRDVMIAIALFATYTAAMVSVRDRHQRNHRYDAIPAIRMIGD